MNLVSLASHTVDMDLLPEAPIVLDAGCRDFGFGLAVLKVCPEAYVLGVDPSPDVMPSLGLPFASFALVGKPRHMALLAMHSTGEGNFICDDVPWYAEAAAVECVTLPELMDRHGIKHWDLVKLDCEGSEFGILENWPGPVAQQISVEFHDWTGPWEEYVKGDYYERLFAGPLKDYEVVQHELSKQGEGVGHWDTLLTLR